MAGALRTVTAADERRTEAIMELINAYSGNSTESARTLVSCLKGLARLAHVPNGNFLTVEWEFFADDEAYTWLEQRFSEHVGRATSDKYRWALNRLLRHLALRNMVDRDLLAETLSDRDKRPPRPASASREVRPDELRSMLLACRRDVHMARGDRDAALLAFLAGTGARRAEVARLTFADIDSRWDSVRLRTKGRQVRDAYLLPVVAEYIEGWSQHHPTGRGALWLPVCKDGSVVPGPGVSDRTLHRIVANRRDQVGADQRIGAHSFRHFFVTSLLDEGADVFTAMRAVGHRRPETTVVYDKRNVRAVQDAVARLHIPRPSDLEDIDDEEGRLPFG